MDIGIALYHRDHFSKGHSRKVFGLQAYHWAVLATAKTDQEDGLAFDVTDSNVVDPVTFRMTNPEMDWHFRVRSLCPDNNVKMLGRLVIGQTPEKLSEAELRTFFGEIPIPVKNKDPQESCVSWARDAVCALQTQGWVPGFDVDAFQARAVAYADERMKGDASTDPAVMDYAA